MTDGWQPPARGALDDTQWPERLVAKAIEPGGEDDRLHGYAVVGDLAKHYELSEVLYLAITGELPTDAAAQLFRVALTAWSAMGVNEAPTHIALLSRICGGAMASALGAGLIAAADQARFIVESNSELVAWLRTGTGTGALPAACTSSVADDAGYVRGLRAAAPHSALLRDDMTRDGARVALLFEAGVQDASRMEAAIVAARVSGLAAEALLASPRDLGSYPVKLPPFHYVEGGAR